MYQVELWQKYEHTPHLNICIFTFLFVSKYSGTMVPCKNVNVKSYTHLCIRQTFTPVPKPSFCINGEAGIFTHGVKHDADFLFSHYLLGVLKLLVFSIVIISQGLEPRCRMLRHPGKGYFENWSRVAPKSPQPPGGPTCQHTDSATVIVNPLGFSQELVFK